MRVINSPRYVKAKGESTLHIAGYFFHNLRSSRPPAMTGKTREYSSNTRLIGDEAYSQMRSTPLLNTHPRYLDLSGFRTEDRLDTVLSNNLDANHGHTFSTLSQGAPLVVCQVPSRDRTKCRAGPLFRVETITLVFKILKAQGKNPSKKDQGKPLALPAPIWRI